VPWEGNPQKIIKHMSKNPDCQTAYRNLICYINFPRCDEARNSLLVCSSVCNNFFKSCGYPQQMNRCGPFKYYGGSAPEPPASVDSNGVPSYLRAMFPGQPFTENQGTLPVCTPALADGAASVTLGLAALCLVAIATIWLL
jgi:hypothetical protein